MLKPDINDHTNLVKYLEQALMFYKAESPKHEGSHKPDERIRDWLTEARIFDKLESTHPAHSKSLIDFLKALQDRHTVAKGVNHMTLTKWIEQCEAIDPGDISVFQQAASNDPIPLTVFLHNMKHRYEATNRSTKNIDRWLTTLKSNRVLKFSETLTPLEFLEAILREYETADGYKELVEGVRALVNPPYDGEGSLLDQPPRPYKYKKLHTFLNDLAKVYPAFGASHETLARWIEEVEHGSLGQPKVGLAQAIEPATQCDDIGLYSLPTPYKYKTPLLFFKALAKRYPEGSPSRVTIDSWLEDFTNWLLSESGTVRHAEVTSHQESRKPASESQPITHGVGANRATIDELVGNIADWLQSEPIKELHAVVNPPQESREPSSEPPPVTRVEVYICNLQPEPQDIREKAYFDQLAASEAAKPKPAFFVADAPAVINAIFEAIQRRGK